MMSELPQAEQKWLDAWHRGPLRLRWDRIPLQIGDSAPDLELADHTGQLVRLSTFWTDGPAEIGRASCRERV